jgi:steroid 5-alpha reductase family enzyme
MEFVLANILFFSLFYIIALIKDDFGIIDVAWGLSFLVLFITGTQINSIAVEGRLLILGVAFFIWAFRLSGYILYRNIKLKHEDPRYTEMRKGWGKNIKLNAYFRVYVLQALLSLIVASPIIALFSQEKIDPLLSLIDFIGMGLLAFGFLFESIADYQKNKFKSNIHNKGKPCNVGLWKYSRHPNYFGEAVFWWGIALLTVTQVPIYWALLGPVFITFLLIKVSGVAMLEKSYEENNIYGEYRKTTSEFIPWIPKKLVN